MTGTKLLPAIILVTFAMLFAACDSPIGGPEDALGLLKDDVVIKPRKDKTDEEVIIVQPTLFTITFDSKEGSDVPSQTVEYRGLVDKPKDPTRSGYLFFKWYKDTNFVYLYNFSDYVFESFTLHAKWDPACTVTFDSNGGTPTPASQTVVSGETVGCPSDPTREGYRLINWYLYPGIPYDFSTPVTRNITLYANWESLVEDYLVTFDSNGGSHVPSQPSSSGGTISEPSKPTKEHCTFDGWYSDSGLNNPYIFSTPVTRNITLYAKWKAITYTVTFNSNGGNSVPSQTVDSGKTASRPVPTKVNYTFDGWYTAANVLYDFSDPVIGNITLYAKWVSVVTFYANGGSGNPPASQRVPSSYSITLPSGSGLSRGGYNFGGWNTNASGTGTNYAAGAYISPTGNMSLYAKWDIETGGPLTEQVWLAILQNIANDPSFNGDLDLSAYTRSSSSTGGGLRSDGTFDLMVSVTTGKNKITSLILPATATSIWGSSSYSFSSLKNVKGPEIISIDSSTFRGFTNLTGVDFPKVTTIGIMAFQGCSSLTGVSFPEVTSIDQETFRECYSLTDVKIPKATSIGILAFAACRSLTKVSFPNAMSIGVSAFSNCTSLTEVSFPEVTSIGGAFQGCTSLTKVSFPKVTSIVGFMSCTNLTDVSFPVATSIGDYAFYYCSSLANVNIPQATSIGEYAFAYCSNLTDVSFPEVTSAVDTHAFYYCSSLANVNIPQATSIGEGAFAYCSSLIEVNFPKVTSIGGGAFGSNERNTLTIGLGIRAPTLGSDILYYGGLVTIKVPRGATGYSPFEGTNTVTVQNGDNEVNWANGLRGAGWDGFKFTFSGLNNGVHTYITVIIQRQ